MTGRVMGVCREEMEKAPVDVRAHGFHRGVLGADIAASLRRPGSGQRTATIPRHIPRRRTVPRCPYGLPTRCMRPILALNETPHRCEPSGRHPKQGHPGP